MTISESRLQPVSAKRRSGNGTPPSEPPGRSRTRFAVEQRSRVAETPRDRQLDTIDLVLSTADVVRITGRHRATIHRWMRSGYFPLKRTSRGRAIGWLRSEIEAWLAGAPPGSQ